MRIWILQVLVAAALVTGCVTDTEAAPSCSDPVGQWKNELGSTLKIDSFDASTGLLSGEYKSPSGTSGTWFPLKGWLNAGGGSPTSTGDKAVIIQFAVNWGKYGSATSWIGPCRPNAEAGSSTLKTLWNLGRASAQFEWDHILSGSDTFTPVS